MIEVADGWIVGSRFYFQYKVGKYLYKPVPVCPHKVLTDSVKSGFIQLQLDEAQKVANIDCDHYDHSPKLWTTETAFFQIKPDSILSEMLVKAGVTKGGSCPQQWKYVLPSSRNPPKYLFLSGKKWLIKHFLKIFYQGSVCVTVGRTVVSNTRNCRFKSSYQRDYFLLTAF